MIWLALWNTACGPALESPSTMEEDEFLAQEMKRPADGDNTAAFCERHPTHQRCAPPAACGDGTCDAGEDCASCESDCGACETCGDGTCDAGEDCGSCESDCGACATCGDGTCDADEDCASCESDCGACEDPDPDPGCGDGVCDATEGCRDCPSDCSDIYPWPAAWVAYEDDTIDGFNAQRAVGASCGGVAYGAQPAVVYDASFVWAARCHAMDMSTTSGISHTGTDGSSFSERMIEAGYTGSPYGEIAAAGYSSPASVVTGWMGSSGHCSIIMSGSPEDVAVGYYYESGTPYGHYWVGNFGSH